MSKKRSPQYREILFEFYHTSGNSVRVSALDPHTNTEITLIGDKRYSEKRLMGEAARKLMYVLNKKNREK
jgi:hypothetical protein